MLKNKQVMTILSVCIFSIVGCGGSDEVTPTQSNETTAPESSTTLETTTTVAASDHTFKMFDKQQVNIENASDQTMTLYIFNTDESVLLKTSVNAGGTKAVQLKIPSASTSFTLLWSGYDPNIGNYSSISSSVTELPLSLIFNEFPQ